MTEPRLRFEDLADDDFTPDADMTIVNSTDEIPHFANEQEAADWWDTHSLASHLWSSTRRGPYRKRTHS